MTKISGWLWLVRSLILAVFGIGVLLTGASAGPNGTLSGVVVDSDGPVSEASVRIRATENATTTSADGRFWLSSLIEGESVELTAWADGYYTASKLVTPTLSDVILTLRRYHTQDHPDYEWTSPTPDSSEKACGNCHPMILPQWTNNEHGGAISNPRFFSLYNGTNISGTIDIGPGYQRDFPGTAGNCANCHAPGAAVDGYLTTNMNHVRDQITDGIHCDFCHKIGGTYLNSITQSVYPNTPGVRSLRVLRPPSGDNIFFGPYDDIPDPDTYLPLLSESQFCAACHQFSFWGTPIYESYNEWLESPYAEGGVTCQDCHMPPSGDTYFASPEVGGLEHPADKIPSHFQLGADDIEFLQDTITMAASAQQVGSIIKVSVSLTNSNAGHHVPTDFPGRHMILTIKAMDSNGNMLTQIDGSTVPEWGGQQSGMPGTAYAKILMDLESGDAPVANYWKQTQILSDNRIPALAVDVTNYSFSSPADGDIVSIKIQLTLRRVFQDLSDQKAWDRPDIIMTDKEFMLTIQPISYLYVPILVKQ